MPAGLFEAYKDGTLELEKQTAKPIPDAPPPPPYKRHAADSPKIELSYASFCELARVLGVTLPPQLALECALALDQVRHRSPYHAVGYDHDNAWPPGAPGMAPWLVKRAAHTLTALPRLLSYSAALSPADEAWALAHGLTALRILDAVGVQDTFARLAPLADAYVARNHPARHQEQAHCQRDACRAPRCSLPLPECDDRASVPLDVYAHLAAPHLGQVVAQRMQSWTGEPLDQLRAELYATLTEEAWSLANGGTFPWEYTWPPELAVVMALAHYNTWPTPDTPLQVLKAFLDRAAEVAKATDPSWPQLEALRACARGVGLQLQAGLVAH